MKLLNLTFSLAAMSLIAVMIFVASFDVNAQSKTTLSTRKTEKKETKKPQTKVLNNANIRKPSNSSTTQQTYTTTVYAAGKENGFAVLWTNGVAQILNSACAGEANSVYVSGNDVYVLYTVEINQIIPHIWKNGNITRLNVETGKNYFLNRIFVSGNDVYAVGREQNTDGTGSKIVLWKNNVKQYITDGSQSAHPVSLYVSNNKVYILGREKDPSSSTMISKLWVLGETFPLVYPESFTAYSIFVVNNDIYVAGSDYPTATVRVNNNLITYPTPNSCATGIFVSGNDVYVAGNVIKNPTYKKYVSVWKNGVQTDYTDGTLNTEPSSIFVLGNDIYVSGNEYNDANKSAAKIWKNGQVTLSIGDGTKHTEVYSIYVK